MASTDHVLEEVLQWNDEPPPPILPLLESIPNYCQAFPDEVQELLNRGLPQGCKVVNTIGNGSCLIYALAIVLGSAKLPAQCLTKKGGFNKTHTATGMRQLIQDLAHDRSIPDSFIFYDEKTFDMERDVRKQLKISPDDYDENIASFFDAKLRYGSRKLDSYAISIEAPIFVPYVALHFNANFVVHTLGPGNDNDPEDATQGLKRWSTHIYHPDGSAEAVNLGYSSFTVLNWRDYPYQIILYLTGQDLDEHDNVQQYLHYIPILSMTCTTLPVMPPIGEPCRIEKEVARRVPGAPTEPTASTVPPTLTNHCPNGELYGQNKEASQDVVGSPPIVLLLPPIGEPEAAVVGASKESTDSSVRPTVPLLSPNEEPDGVDKEVSQGVEGSLEETTR